MECMTHSPFLFTTAAGEAMRFCIQWCAEKDRLTALIEHGGGVIKKGKAYDSRIIRLTDCERSNVRDKGKVLYVQYLLDCVDQNRLLDKTGYSLSIDDENNSINNMGQAKVNQCAVAPYNAFQATAQFPNSVATNMRIINYIFDNADRLKGMYKFEFYKELLKNKVMHGSYKAFEHRVRRIFNKPKFYKLTTKKEKFIKGILSSMKRKKTFTKKDEKKMIKYVVKNKLHKSVWKRAIYEEMEKKKLLDRDAASMHYHFREVILQNLHSYNIPRHDIALLTHGNPNLHVKKVISSKGNIDCIGDESENEENGYSLSDLNKNRSGSTKTNLKKQVRDISNKDDRDNDFVPDIVTTEDSSDESDDESNVIQSTMRRGNRRKVVVIQNRRIIKYILKNADRLWRICESDFYAELVKNKIIKGSKYAFTHRIYCIYEDIKVYKLTTKKEKLVRDILLKMNSSDTPFTKREDKKMIDYVIDNRLYERVQEKIIYEEMANKRLLMRDAIAMYKQFIEIILPNLQSYNLWPYYVNLLRSGNPNSLKVEIECNNDESENEKSEDSVSDKHRNSVVKNKTKSPKQNREIVQTDNTHGVSNETSKVLHTIAGNANKVTAERTNKISEYFAIAKKNPENALDVQSKSEMKAKDDKGHGEDVELLTCRSHQSCVIETLHRKDEMESESISTESENEWSLSDYSEDTSIRNRESVKLNYSFRPRTRKQITEKHKHDDEDLSSSIDFSSDDSSDAHRMKKSSQVSSTEKRMDLRHENNSSCDLLAKHQTSAVSNKIKSSLPEIKTEDDSGQDTLDDLMSEDEELPDREFDVENNAADEFSTGTNAQASNQVDNDMDSEKKNGVENEDNLQNMVIDQGSSSAKQDHFTEYISILKNIEENVAEMDHSRKKDNLQNNINELYFEFYQQRFKDNIRSIAKKEKLSVIDKAILMKYIAYTKNKKPEDFVHDFVS